MADEAAEGTTGVARCVDAIRDLILTGELLPGQKLHQGVLAEQLSVSRIPVREALSRLHSEGLLVHRPNTGYTVARFDAENLSEIYLMRRLLETELIASADLGAVDVAAMRHANEQLRSMSSRREPRRFQTLNMELHFALFDASPLELVRAEVERLWNMSSLYRSLYLLVGGDSDHLCAEHEAIIEAVVAGDRGRVIALSDEHRARTSGMDLEVGRTRAVAADA